MQKPMAVIWFFTLCLAAHATSIVLDPRKSQTLEGWAAKPTKGVTEIHLMPGNHGRPMLMGLSGITIDGDGQKAILGRTWVVNCRDVLFRQIKFRDLKNGDNNWKNALFFSDAGSNDIRVEDSSFAATDDTSTWTDADWLRLPYGQLVYSNAQGAIFSGNDFFNAFTVMSINGNGWIVSHNLMHDFVNDGTDFRGSNVSIRDNRIFDSHDIPSNPMHADGIQGMAALPTTPQPYANVQILNNYVDAGTKTKSPMQGISAFDGKWKDVVIKGNYVRPRAYHGISWSGVDDIVIDQNVVDQFKGPGGRPIVSYPALPPPWICVNSAKDKTPSTHLIIGRNITPRYACNSIAALRPAAVPVKSLP